MPKLKTLSGKDVIRVFTGFDFHEFSQKGSHIKLRRTLPSGHHQSSPLWNHAEIGRVTCTRFIDKPSDSTPRMSCGHIFIQTNGGASAAVTSLPPAPGLRVHRTHVSQLVILFEELYALAAQFGHPGIEVRNA